MSYRLTHRQRILLQTARDRIGETIAELDAAGIAEPESGANQLAHDLRVLEEHAEAILKDHYVQPAQPKLI